MTEAMTRILLVEDDDDYVLTRDLLARISGGTYTLDWVTTFDAGLAAAGEQRHDIYLIDYRLEADSGIDLLRALLNAGCGAPIILLTGQGNPSVDSAAMQAGAADYLVKGEITTVTLERALRHARDRGHILALREALAQVTRETLAREAGVLAMKAVTQAQDNYDLTRSNTELEQQATLARATDALAQVTRETLALEAGVLAKKAVTQAQDNRELTRSNTELEQQATLARAADALAQVARETLAREAGSLARKAVTQAQDNRELTRSNAGLEQLARAAEQLAAMRSDFVDAVSHELRTPLTAMLGYGELLQGHWDELSDAQRRDRIDRMVGAANRQHKLIENLLRVSRIDSNSPAPRREPIRLADVVARAARVVQSSYPGQRIDAVGPTDVVATADPQHTEQIVTNLLDNAAKYSEEGQPIHVAWELEAGMVALRVRDGGAGIPSEGRDILFSRFGRVPGSRMRAGHVGTGLGLYLSRTFAEAMGGTLDLESTSPTGSVFCLRLPLRAETTLTIRAEGSRSNGGL
jgi:signal transduction histidine kinase